MTGVSFFQNSVKGWERRLPLIYASFWLTILGLRFALLLFGFDHETPAVMIRGVHVHHFVTGFLILLIAILTERSRSLGNDIKALLYGIGLALIADEFIFWTHLDFNYWDFYNFIFPLVLSTGILLLYFQLLKSRDSHFSHHTHRNPVCPPISVVIPAHNEANFIGQTLSSMLAQTYQNFELIVVDNNSTDNTADVASSYGAKIIFESQPGVAAARQSGFLAASGSIIATTDADTILPADWLEKIVEKFQCNQDLAAYGGLYRLHSGPIFARLLFPDIAYLAWLFDQQLNGTWSLAGANMAVRKEAFLRAGGFDSNLKVMEDAELSKKIAAFGKVVLDRNLLVSTSGRRYSHGLLKGLLVYSKATKPVRKIVKIEPHLPPIRAEKKSRLHYFAPLVPVVLLGLLFLSNTAYAEAKEKPKDELYRIVKKSKDLRTFMKSGKHKLYVKWEKYE